ncbi:hypothetical protein WJX73_000199 [Symbiochloris irregularis]|uniref:Uncharacterized protein n=1 Tax=Symbiochloris irregularis TaxID=706552 RepID=A0AAW1NQX7_9CHLO
MAGKPHNHKFTASVKACEAKQQIEQTGVSTAKALTCLLEYLTPQDYVAHPPGPPMKQPCVSVWLSSHEADRRLACLLPAIIAATGRPVPAAAMFRAALESYLYKPDLRDLITSSKAHANTENNNSQATEKSVFSVPELQIPQVYSLRNMCMPQLCTSRDHVQHEPRRGTYPAFNADRITVRFGFRNCPGLAVWGIELCPTNTGTNTEVITKSLRPVEANAVGCFCHGSCDTRRTDHAHALTTEACLCGRHYFSDYICKTQSV